jgi:hypothetical protein
MKTQFVKIMGLMLKLWRSSRVTHRGSVVLRPDSGVFMANVSGEPRLVQRREIRRLIGQLAHASQKRAGARLTPGSVNLMLAVLKAHAGGGAAARMNRSRAMFQIELVDRQGWSEKVIATFSDALVADAALDEARRRNPGRTIILRGDRR